MKKLLLVTNSHLNEINHLIDAFKLKRDLILNIEYLHKKDRNFSLLTRLFNKLRLPIDIDWLNVRILIQILRNSPDIILIMKGNYIFPWLLRFIKKSNPQIKLVSWSGDNMFEKHNRSIYYTLGLKYYDKVFTTKSCNCDPSELKTLGAKKVIFHNQSYSKIFHKPCSNCDEISEKHDVLFIGYAEQDRFQYMNYLAKNGINIHIYGGGWDRGEYKFAHPNLIIHNKILVGEDYANALSCSKISLCFLRKANRDLQTSRSIEIPACGGFMVAERTNEHLFLYSENEEAVFFETKNELLNKVRYYLKHEHKRKSISKSGLRRTQKEDYSYENRVDFILRKINES